MKVVFFGTPPPATIVLKQVIEAGHDVVGIVTQKDKSLKPLRTSKEDNVSRYASRNDIEKLQPESLNVPEVKKTIADLGGDIAVVAAYGKIIPKSILGLWEKGCFCIHPSLLPRYRGASPIQEAILQGDEVTGTSIFLVEEKMDAGPILAQKRLTVAETDTTVDLLEKLFYLGAEMVGPAIDSYISSSLLPVPQDHSQATFTKLLKKNDGAINWLEAAELISRKNRAYIPWPGIFTFWKGKRLNIISTRATGADSDHMPGQVMGLDPATNQIMVSTGNGVLAVDQLQLEGKRCVAAPQFLRGYPSFGGTTLPS